MSKLDKLNMTAGSISGIAPKHGGNSGPLINNGNTEKTTAGVVPGATPGASTTTNITANNVFLNNSKTNPMNGPISTANSGNGNDGNGETRTKGNPETEATPVATPQAPVVTTESVTTTATNVSNNAKHAANGGVTIEEVLELMAQLKPRLESVMDVCKLVTSALGGNDTNKKSVEEILNNVGKTCIDTLNQKGGITRELIEFLKLELSSTFGVFSVLTRSHYSDVIITAHRITLSSHLYGKSVVNIPQESLAVYQYLVMHMINNVIFYNGKKFDPGNAILDAQMEGVRFNVTHACLNTLDNFPVVVMRIQVMGNDRNKTNSLIANEKKYLDGIGASEEQRKVLEECSMKKNFFIFGTVGSGKTVLLKYLANKNLDKKNNLCTIEDTAELFVPTNLALQTNQNYSIKDLFTASLRQNPSSLYIGETRTAEIVDILEAGLAFSIGSTIHATSLQKAIERIFFMSLPRHIDRESVMSLIVASVDVFIFMDKLKLKGMWEKDSNAPVDYTNISKIYKPIE